jgi:acyl-CoA synthetase (AMP-forming)/AMP-acid ligase II
MTWACWMAGNTAVPLPATANAERLAFLIKDSGATVVLATKEFVSHFYCFN